MAISYKIVLRKDKANAKGESPLYLRITEDRKSSYKALGVFVSSDLWDEERQKVKSKHPNSARVNNFLTNELAKAQGKALDMVAANIHTSARRIKQAVKRQSDVSFTKYFQNYLDCLKKDGKIGTFDKASATFSKLKQYTREQDLAFTDIDIAFLKNYDRHLREKLGNTTNTIHSNLKIIRMLFNQATTEGLITLTQNPFIRGFKIPTEKTVKAYITEDELKTLEQLQIKEQFMLNHHRWMYVFACYAGGLRISDLLQLRWRHYNGEHIVITMQKTGDPIAIKVVGQARRILETYQPITGNSPDAFIFPCLDNDIDYSDKLVLFRAISSSTAYANKNLKQLAVKAQIDKPLSFHTSRHTFATRALKKGVRMEYVSKLLGHTNLRTTQVYAKIVNEELDKAMDVLNE